MEKSNQQNVFNVSGSFLLAVLLTLSGGFMDTYSYMCRDEVFANAQTGNLLLFGVNLSTGNFSGALRYFIPILAFVVGIIITEIIRYKFSYNSSCHWRQIILLIEAILLCFVAFMPQSYNLLANSLISLVCGAQVQGFRTVNGNQIATTMCIGNLRSATECLCEFINSKEKCSLKNSFFYFTFIAIFVVGAILGNFCVNWFHEKSIIISSLLLVSGFVWMLFEKGVRIKK